MVDLNSDLGESFGVYRLGMDADVLQTVTSANVACGFHAGDPQVMAETVSWAAACGVAVGAHPGYPDRVGFGRRDLGVTPKEAATDVLYQIGALASIAQAAGVALQHVKLHGALYNRAMTDDALAQAVAQAIAAYDGRLIVFALPASALERAALKEGLRVAREAFADRAYTADGRLLPRSVPGAVLHDPAAVVQRAVRIATEGRVTSHDGQEVVLQAETLCVHGDNPAAVELVTAIRAGLIAAGVVVQAVGQR